MLTKRDELLRKALCLLFKHTIHADLIAIIQSTVDKEDSILDIGCGIKTFVKFLRCKKLVGFDIYKDYLEEGDILGDVKELDKLVSESSFDVVLCFDLIEHLTKEEGFKLIKDMLKVCREKIIIFTPTEWTDNKDGVENKQYWSFGNKYNYHQSLWTREDFFKLRFIEYEHQYKKDYIIVVKEKG